MARLLTWRVRGESNEFLENAYALLTREWSRSAWRSRAGLLRSAQWLIQLGAR